MRKISVVFCILAATGFVVSGCAETRVKRVETRPALMEYHAGTKDYIKKVAVMTGVGGRYSIDPQLNQRYFNTMAQSLAKQSLRLKLFIPGDDGFPDFGNRMSDGNQTSNVPEAARLARINGFNALLGTSLVDIRTDSEIKGFWLWRRTEYRVIIAVSLEILDPFTAAKSTNLIQEETIKCDKATYEAVKVGQWDTVAPVDKALAQLARTMAKIAIEQFQRLRWQTTVLSVDGDRLSLAAGKTHGLAAGDPLVVFEGRDVISGYQGLTYIAPGYQVGVVRISKLDQDRAEAKVLEGQVGDIVVPAINPAIK